MSSRSRDKFMFNSSLPRSSACPVSVTLGKCLSCRYSSRSAAAFLPSSVNVASSNTKVIGTGMVLCSTSAGASGVVAARRMGGALLGLGSLRATAGGGSATTCCSACFFSSFFSAGASVFFSFWASVRAAATMPSKLFKRSEVTVFADLGFDASLAASRLSRLASTLAFWAFSALICAADLTASASLGSALAK